MKNVSVYKKLNYEYEVLEQYISGIVLEGWEVPSINLNGISLNESYVVINNNEVFLRNSYINVAKNKLTSNTISNDIKRDRKLLLTKREIKRIKSQLETKGLTAIVSKVYKHNNLYKCEISICRGKKNYDKRQDIKDRDIKRENQRILNER